LNFKTAQTFPPKCSRPIEGMINHHLSNNYCNQHKEQKNQGDEDCFTLLCRKEEKGEEGKVRQLDQMSFCSPFFPLKKEQDERFFQTQTHTKILVHLSKECLILRDCFLKLEFET
jgi:hypothetical protein